MTYKEVTIYDIAEKLNISTATVSRGLRNNPVVSKHTRKKIHDLARQLGYRSNTFASNLRRQRTNTIGVIVPRLNSNFMSSVLSGMERIADEAGYNLIISQSQESYTKECANVLTMYNRRVDALVVSLAYNTTCTSHFDIFHRKGIPLVFFDRVSNQNGSPAFVIDNHNAGYEITKHLIDQGCKRLVHITGNLIRNVYKERHNGFIAALRDAKLNYSDDSLFLCDLSIEAGQKAAKWILDRNPRPDGVFIANDSCAISCMSHLKAEGISIPKDIAIAGFNNDPITNLVNPPLTSYNYAGTDMGELVMRYIIEHLAGKGNFNCTNKVILNSGLVARQSTLRKG